MLMMINSLLPVNTHMKDKLHIEQRVQYRMRQVNIFPTEPWTYSYSSIIYLIPVEADLFRRLH